MNRKPKIKVKTLHIRLSEVENDDLNEKAKLCRLSKSALIRLLIKGYKPKEKTDERFYAALKELYAIGNNLNQLAYKVNKLNLIDKDEYKRQVGILDDFITKLEKEFLEPEKSELRYK